MARMRDIASNTLAKNRQAGDTIVEVILAVAIISSVLAGAFAVTSRSSRDIRVSEEHAQALQYLQGQVELLRSAAAKPGYLLGSGWLNSGFCLDANNIYESDSGGTDNNCKVGANPTAPYVLHIQKNPLSSGPTTTFDLEASWASLNRGNDRVDLSYKVQLAS